MTQPQMLPELNPEKESMIVQILSTLEHAGLGRCLGWMVQRSWS